MRSAAAGQVEMSPWDVVQAFPSSTADVAAAGAVGGVVDRALDVALEVARASVAFIALIDEAGDRQEVYSRVSDPACAPGQHEIDQFVAGSPNGRGVEANADHGGGRSAFRGEPLQAAGRRIGMIGVAGPIGMSIPRRQAFAVFAELVAAAIEIASLRRRRQEMVDTLLNLRADLDRSERLRLRSEERAESAIRLERAHELAVEALLGVSVPARATANLAEFDAGLTAAIAGLVCAEGAIFWQLDKEGALIPLPGAQGIESARLPLLPKLRAVQGGDGAASQVVYGDQVLRSSRSGDSPRSELDLILVALNTPNAISAAWRAGEQRLGMVSAFHSHRPDGFSVEDAWVLQMGGLAAGLARQLKHAESDLNQSVQRLEKVDEARKLLLRNMSTAVEKARKRLAHELHDDALQKLTAAELQLQRARDTADGAGPRPPIIEARRLLEQVEQALRKLLFELRPPAIDEPGGFERSIRERIEILHSVTGISPEIELDVPESQPVEIKALVFRQVAEALTNIEKHAAATRVSVAIGMSDGGIHGDVRDDGRGFVVAERDHLAGHLGLLALRERALLAGGWCEIKSQPGAGTAIEFWIPVTS